jgi:hypothetical protein
MKVVWPWPPPNRRDVIGALLAIVIVILALLAQTFSAEVVQRTNYRFGSEWDCFIFVKGAGLSCIKPAPYTPR